MIPRTKHAKSCAIHLSREYCLDCDCGAAQISDTWAPSSMQLCADNDMRASVKLSAFVASWPFWRTEN